MITLNGRNCSLVLESAGGAPIWRYWGPRLVEGAPPPLIADIRPAASFSLDARPAPDIFPLLGTGIFHTPALLAHRDGRDFAHAFTRVETRWIAAGRAVAFEMVDDVGQVQVTLSIALDPDSDVATFETSLTNHGNAPLDVHWLAAATLLLPPDAARRRFYTGRHDGEFIPHDEAIGAGGWRQTNRRGISSHEAFPGALVAMPGATDCTGLVYGAQLAWSGNHEQAMEFLGDGAIQWQFGEWLAPGEMRLAAGETLTTPQLLATLSTAGFDGVAQNFHTAIRARAPWHGGEMRPRPVHLNSWEALYFDHDEARLRALADRASAIGVERFVLDDGWFKGRDDDHAGLGDWTVDGRKYPAGLGPLAAHVNGLGMEFGLWVEPEMVNPDSDLYRAHPEWALQIAGRPMQTARNQCVLDLSRAEVTDYLFGALDALLTDLPITYLKWDHNRHLTLAGGADGRARYHAQVLAAYALLDHIRTAHPQVEIEACAGGGGRIDAGIAARTHRFWPSDCIDAARRVPLQRGFLQFMPPEMMGSHVGASPAHSTSRSQSMGYRCAIALPGHFGVELDPDTLAPADHAELVRWIAIYKTQRDRLHHGQVWRGTAGDGILWQAHGTPDDLILLVYRPDPAQWLTPPSLRLPMLNTEQDYAISLVAETATAGHAAPDAPFFAGLRAGPAVMGGGWLAQAGLPLPAMRAENAVVFLLAALPKNR